MTSSHTSKRSPLIFVLFYFIIWIILFEFILPANNILPKPSIVIQSFGALLNDYSLPYNFLNTISSVYLPIIIAYLLIHLLSYFFVSGKNLLTDLAHSFNWFSKFLPGILIGFLLVYWFPGSIIIEFVFAFITSFLSFIIFLQKIFNALPTEYINSARSLGVLEKRIRKEVIWKSLQPEIFGHIYELHLYIWSLIIAFEFIKGNYGLGNIFRQALLYKDLSAIFSMFIIVGVTVFVGKTIISYLNKKFAFWSL